MLRALQGAGLPVTDTRSWTLEQLDHPGIPALLEYKKLSRLLAANGWTWLDTWAREGRFRSWFLPGGVVTGRWASTGGGALSVPVQVRPAAVADEGWRLVVADVAQLEPRVLAGMSGDTGHGGGGAGEPTSTRAWSTAVPWRPGPRPRSASSGRCTGAPAVRAGA